MKEIIYKIDNIQRYCSMIKQNNVDTKIDIFMNDVDLDTFGKLAEHYNVVAMEADGMFICIHDENCAIFINLKN